jgi:alpha-1,2-mannosyltransferase
MSKINPSLRGDALSPFVPGCGKRLRPEFVLLMAQALALVAFLSFCVMWVQWQSVPWVTKISGDFISFWSAGQLALEGHAADAYLRAPLFLKEVALHGNPGWGFIAFFYPPIFLLLSAGFALLGYFPALCLWLAATCAGYIAAMQALLPTRLRDGMPAWIVLLGYPAVMVNAGFGQNGFLSTALLGGGAVLMDRRPALAGVCLGCLAYKPQLGIIVPLALAVAGRWRCFAAAAATVLALAGAATLAFGMDIWPPFIANLAVARRDWMEPANPLYLQYWITVYGAVRLHGGPLALAYGAQTLATVVAAGALVFALLRRPPGVRSGRAEGAALAACVPFCSPFMLEYDLVILAVPMAWLLSEALRDGFRRGEIAALIAVYLAPVLFKLTLLSGALKISAIAASALLFAVVLRRMMTPGRQG